MKDSHIVDPSTGMGLARLIAVTVVARRGIDADGWSTTLSVLGPPRGLALIEQHSGMAALVVAGPGTAESSGWARLACQFRPPE